MNRSLFFNNKKYISTKEAGYLTGYSKDYIGQLARSNKIDCKKVGRVWYVGEESIVKYNNSPTKTESPSKSEFEDKPSLKSTNKKTLSKNEKLSSLKKAQPKVQSRKTFKFPDNKKVLSPVGKLAPFAFGLLFAVFVFSGSNFGFLNTLKTVTSVPANFLTANLGKIFNSSGLVAGYTSDSLVDAYKNYILSPEEQEGKKFVGVLETITAYRDYIKKKIAEAPAVKVSTSTKTRTQSSRVASSRISNSSLISALRSLLAGDLPSDIRNNLRGATGATGAEGPQGVKGGASVSFYTTPPTASPYVGPVGLLGSFASLGVQELLVSGNSTLSGSLTVSGTIAGSILGPIDPSFTLGSVAFQGADGLTEDNSNFFWDDTNNYLGIGTATPTTALDVSGVISATSIDLGATTLLASRSLTIDTGGGFDINMSTASGDDFSIDTSSFVVEGDTGNVGIGTASPSANLDLVQLANGDTMFGGHRQTDTAPSGDFILYRNAADDTTLFRVDNSGNLLAGGIVNSGSQTITSTSQPQLRVQYDSSNEWTSSTTSAGITTFAYIGTTPQGLFVPGTDSTTAFQFRDASANPILNIDTTNVRVGINTTAPQSLLDVQGNEASPGLLTLATKGTTTVDGDVLGRIDFNAPLDTAGGDAILAGAAIWAEADDTFSASVNSTELVFATNTSAAATERMRIDSAGNVGIGNTTPGTTLDVTGTGRFSSTLTASDGLTLTTGAMSLTATSGALTLSGLSASSISTGANDITFTAGNFNTTATGINSTAIGVTTPAAGNFTSIGDTATGTGAFTTLTSSGSTTLATGSSTTNTFGSGASSINTIGSTTTPGALTLHGATTLDNTFSQTGANTFGTGTGAVSLNGATSVTGSNTFTVGTGLSTLGGDLTVTGTVWTATPTISGLVTMTSGFDSNSASTVAGLTVDTNGNLIVSNGTLSVTAPSTTGNAGAVIANSLTTGTAFNVSSTSTAGGVSGISKLLNLARSGTNAELAHTAYGIYSSVTNTNITSGTNIAGYFSASGATTANYGLIVENGSVGIGVTDPDTRLEILNAGNQLKLSFDGTDNATFGVDTSGNLTITASGTKTTLASNLTVSGTGPHAIGGATLDYVGLNVLGSFTSGGASNFAAGFQTNQNITGAIGDTSILVGTFLNSVIVTQGTDTNINVIAQLYLDEPTITNNLASAGKPDVAATLYIEDAPTEGDNNYALIVDAGDVRFDGNTILAGDITQTNGATALARNSTGDVLTVTQSGSGDSAIFLGGNVGIGTASPDTMLHIANTVANKSLIRMEYNQASIAANDIYGAIEWEGQDTSDSGGADGIRAKIQAIAEATRGETALQFMTAGITEEAQERLRITSTGNVGIGTTSPLDLLHVSKASADTRVRIGNNGSYDQFVYFNGGTDWSAGIDTTNSNAFTISNASTLGTSDKLTILTGGNVGIGTVSPTVKLEVRDTANTDTLLVVNSNLTTASLAQFYSNNGSASHSGNMVEIINDFNAGGSADLLYLQQDDDGDGLNISMTRAGVGLTIDGAGSGYSAIFNNGNVGIGTVSPAKKLVISESSSAGVTAIFQNSTTGALGGDGFEVGIDASENSFLWNYETEDIYFGTANNERMRILSGGNVGIGTVSPGSNLHVDGGAEGILTIEGNRTGSANFGTIDFYNTDSGGLYTGARITARNDDSVNDGALYFSTNSDGVSDPTANLATRMVISSAGNVGIGTVSPSHKLEISDSANAQLSLEDTGTGAAYKKAVFDHGDGVVALKIFSDADALTSTPLKIAQQAPDNSFSIVSSGEVGIGVVDPDTQLEILNAGNQLKLSFDGTDNAVFAVDTSGNLTITASGTKTTLADNLVVSGTGPHAIGGATAGWAQFWFRGSYTGDGSSAELYGINQNPILTSVAGDTATLAGSRWDASIVTQTATESIADIAQMVIAEPQITNNLTGTITNASTLKILSAPTEGTNNYALWVDSGTSRFDGDLTLAATKKIYLDGGTDTYFSQLSDNNYTFVAGTVTKLTFGSSGVFTIADDIVVSGTGPHAIGGPVAGWGQWVQSGTFTSDGSATVTLGMSIRPDLVAVAGDTNRIALLEVSNGSITTQNNSETITDVASLRIAEPAITKGTDTITNASTLQILSAPTEGTNNYALWVTSGASEVQALTATTLTGSGILSIDDTTDSTSTTTGSIHTDGGLGVVKDVYIGGDLNVAGTGPHAIGGATDGRYGVIFPSGYTSDGSGTTGGAFTVQGQLTGADGDTVRLHGSAFVNSIVTQTATETIADVAQVLMNEPTITDQLGGAGVITNASTLLITGAPTEGASNYAILVDDGDVRFGSNLTVDDNLTVSGTGPHAIGGATVDYDQIRILGSFTSGGASDVLNGIDIQPTLTAATLDTAWHTALNMQPQMITQNNSETIADIMTMRLVEPNITKGTDTVTNASTLKIVSAPTEGTNNYALWVDAGDVRLDGNLGVGAGPSDNTQFVVQGTFAPGTNANIMAAYLNPSITGTSGQTHSVIASLYLDEPNITVNSSTITTAATLYVQQAPTEGASNYALWVDAGATQLDGALAVVGITTVADGTAAAPGLRFTTSSGLGLFQRTTNVMGFSAGSATHEMELGQDLLRFGSALIMGWSSNADPGAAASDFTIARTGTAAGTITGDLTLTGDLTVSGIGPHAIGGATLDYVQTYFTGSFTSGGAYSNSDKIRLAGALTGATGDTTHLAGARFVSSIVTQTATESITDIVQVMIHEPNITDNLTGTITNASTLKIVSAPTEGTNNRALWVASGLTEIQDIRIAGTNNAIGGTIQGNAGIYFGGNFTSSGATTSAYHAWFDQVVTGASGDTTLLAGTRFESNITTQTATESITDIAQVIIDEPTITDNLTGSITNASTLKITGAPTEGTNNYALWVDAGDTRLDGFLDFSTQSSPRIIMGTAELLFREDTDGGTRFSIQDNGDIYALGDIAIAGTGPHAIGGATVDNQMLRITGSYTSGGAGTKSFGMAVHPTLTGASGDTESLATLDLSSGSIVTQTVAETITDVARVILGEPQITKNVTTITNASTLKITGAPTEGETNRALWVASDLTEVQALTANSTSGTSPIITLSAAGNTSGAFIDIQESGSQDWFIGIPDADSSLEFRPATIGASAVMTLTTAGVLVFGTDTNLYRSAADTLKTNDDLIVAGGDLTLGDTKITNVSTGRFDILVAGTSELRLTNTAGADLYFGASSNASIGTLDATNLNLLTNNTTALTIDSNQDTTLVGDLTVSGTGPHAIGGATQDYRQFHVLGSFTSGGGSDRADKAVFTGTLTGFSGDILRLTGMVVAPTIVTQTATESITDIASLIVFEPTITNNLTGSITNASTLKIASAPTEGTNNYALWVDAGDVRFDGALIGNSPWSQDDTTQSTSATTGSIHTDGGLGVAKDFYLAGDLVVSGTGPHAIGGSAIGRIRLELAGSFTSDGSSTFAVGTRASGTITGATGDTGFLAGMELTNAITTQGATETIAGVYQLRVDEPQITIGTGDTVTNSASLYISGVATEATNNYALWVDDGAVRFDGTVLTSGRATMTGGVTINATGGQSDISISGMTIWAAGMSSSTNTVYKTFVSGDSVERFKIQASGALDWGAGGASALDTNLYRSAANTLKTDDNLSVAGSIIIAATQGIYLDGGGDTYLVESSANVIDIFAAGTSRLNISSDVTVGSSSSFVASRAGPHVFGGVTNAGMRMNFTGSFTSAGTATYGLRVDGILTGATTNANMYGGYFANSFVTQGLTETITTVAQVTINEPTLTVGTGDTVTNSASLYVLGAATEATNNYALWVDSGDTRFDGDVGIGTTSPDAQLQIFGIGQTTSALTDAGSKAGTIFIQSNDGSVGAGGALTFGAVTGTANSAQAAIKTLLITGTDQGLADLAFSTRASTGATALTERMRITNGGNLAINATAKFYLDGVAATGDTYIYENSANSVQIVTGGAAALSLSSGIATFNGNLVVSGTGPHAIGGATENYSQTVITGSFTSGGAGTTLSGVRISPALTATTGDTAYLAHLRVQGGSITTQGVTETVGIIATGYFAEPSITVGTGDTVTNSATIYIEGVATEATNNYALWVDNGDVRFDGVLDLTAGDLRIAAIKKFYLDGGGDTYIFEGAANDMRFVVGGTLLAQTSTTEWIMSQDLSIPALKKFYLDGSGDTYIVENSANVLRAVAGGSGGVDLLSGGTSWTAVSDENLKTIIEPITDGLSKLDTLRTVIGRYNDDDPDRRRSFLIAQDVQLVLPEAVYVDAVSGFLRLSYPETIPLIISAVNELNTRSLGLYTATSSDPYVGDTTPSIYIDSAGNIGVGTTTPDYKLHVAGDIAATSFINISTKESKKDIEYLSGVEKTSILDKLRKLNIAKYRYNEESIDAPLRLGLIAEESPSDVLAIGGKGVDIYKLSTFVLAGVQELDLKIGGHEERITALEGNVIAGAGGVDLGEFAVEFFASGLQSMVDGVAYMKGIVTETLTVGSAEKPVGITLFDEVTGAPYCISVANGAQKIVSGECVVVDLAASAGGSGGPAPAGDTTPPVITLNGEAIINLNLNDIYTEEEAIATDDVDGAVLVIVSGTVDTSLAGTYTINYNAVDSAGNNAVEVTRTVNVIDPDAPAPDPASDTTPPVITLNGLATVDLNVGDTYTEDGAVATDDVDGSVTVTTTGVVDTSIAGVYTINYNAVDVAGNNAVEVVRTVNVVEVVASDTTPPVITLNGLTTIDLNVGDTYTEEGATAVDDVDDSVVVTITGTVDTNTAGIYLINYNASDVAGNNAVEVLRTVNVVEVVPEPAPTP